MNALFAFLMNTEYDNKIKTLFTYKFIDFFVFIYTFYRNKYSIENIQTAKQYLSENNYPIDFIRKYNKNVYIGSL